MAGSEDKLFKDITLQGVPLAECEPVYKGKYDNCRLYVVTGDYHSFYAHAVEFNSCSAESAEQDHWSNDSLVVNTLFEVIAYFDGVRHLEFNRNGCDTDGYIYYPPMGDFVAMLQKVREIELEVCIDID